MTAIELKKYIYNENKIEYILEKIGCRNIEYHQNKDYYSCTNVRGGDCNNPAAVNIKNCTYLNYRNFTRGVSYDDQEDLISFVQYSMDMNFIKALKYLHKILELNYEYSTVKEKESEVNPVLNIFQKYCSKKKSRSRCDALSFDPMDEKVLNDFVPYIHIDLFREGIMPRSIKKFELGYSYKWKRTIFPVRYWMDGSLMGYNARTSVENYEEFDIKKYFITPGMKKEINFYGLWENYNSIIKANYITIFEAEKSVVKRHSRFDETAVAVQGHSISDEQLRILRGLSLYEIVIAFDNDVPVEEIWHICDKLYMNRRGGRISYIYDKWNILGEKDSPADASNEQYQFLFDNRVRYTERLHQEYLMSLDRKK